MKDAEDKVIDLILNNKVSLELIAYQLAQHNPVLFLQYSNMRIEDIVAEVYTKQGKIPAIKFYRSYRNSDDCGLVEAKAWIEKLAEDKCLEQPNYNGVSITEYPSGRIR